MNQLSAQQQAAAAQHKSQFSTTAPSGNSMPPPSQVQSSQSLLSTNEIESPSQAAASGALPAKIMLKSNLQAIAQRPTSESPPPAPSLEDRKKLKRAANRRSAQLSRKRKKQFIEELKEENDELRRKEQILKSIPDLIVVFDSSGKLCFVSHSVSRFLDFSPRELEGSSFWERLCDESVRLLKAAFMDALAARKGDMNTTPLGCGVWELRLKDKDGSNKVVTLNGVVHFTGESPECVCSIRPREEDPVTPSDVAALPAHRNVSVSSGSTNNDTSSSSSAFTFLRPPIKPQESVVSSRSDQSQILRVKARKRAAHQISDGDSGSCVSESGSDE